MKKIVALITAAILGLGTLLTVPSVQAAKLTDMQTKKNKINLQRSHVQSGIHAAENKIIKLQSQQRNLIKEIEALNSRMKETTKKIEEKSAAIEKTRIQVKKLNEEILVIKERINKREELLKERARAMQQNGGNVEYLEVLLGSQNFGDFIERISAVSTIMQADRDIIHQQEKDKASLEESEEVLEKELSGLQTMLNDLTNLQAEQTRHKASKKVLMHKLIQQEQETHSHKMNLKEEEELLSAQAAAIQQAINLEKQRLADLETARKRAADQANQFAQPGFALRPSISSGTFTSPANGILSSNFGQRGGENHMGIDIANSGSNIAIVAAADGVVSKSYFSSSYGNVIFITHSINGKIFTTVYAHLKARSAGSGQVVAKGQQIGIMGNTGESRGQHLHFELHNGPWNQNKTHAVNPLGIVPI
ncbi:peptidoglycan hydrolase CwlO-like protein [Peribacillus deserti]|uniref:Peptidoglycan hydrolase CwlO-like protein n=1 Tax=Peribacillus deserti TaxID=673318 RepID=A0ABS2QNQ2_9BACI|nr:peptidoglycan DD-metalloendopeptidase family protein [Peribacillus deserti]MBM7694118.1 peptidoglycan hydrolase CwlO-like protein [Peribacillus deserti]